MVKRNHDPAFAVGCGEDFFISRIARPFSNGNYVMTGGPKSHGDIGRDAAIDQQLH